MSTENKAEVHAGPCIKCGHPPRCHPKRQCDAEMHTEPCDSYEPDPSYIVKIPAAAEGSKS